MNRLPILQFLHPDQLVVAVGAHSDDIALGSYGFQRRLVREAPAAPRIRWIVLSGGNDPERSAEERRAAARLGVDPEIWDFPDTDLTAHFFKIKEKLLAVRDAIGPERIGCVITHRRGDLHQDHDLAAGLAYKVFRDHLILEYDVLKYEGDLGHPNFYVEIPDDLASEKVRALLESYPSRLCHAWWGEETFRALLRLRGVEANVRYAEAFTVRKLVW